MVRINIFCIGKVKESFFKEAIEEYSKRLKKFCELKVFEYSDEKLPENISEFMENNIKNIECNKMLKNIPANSYTISLDLTGKQYSSEDFADKIKSIEQKNSTINFVIGGSLGLSDEIKSKSNELISFSKMTFPHQLIRVFILEQIFRAFKINNNQRYHH